MILGRPKGKSQTLKLDAFETEIKEYLKKGINKSAISKLIECSPSTLYLWLKRKKLYRKS
jgi:transposase-like protein